jgi:hypothetical protein
MSDLEDAARRVLTAQCSLDHMEAVDDLHDALDAIAAAETNGSAVDVSDLKITTLSDVEAERVEWLWMGRLPRGKLVVFDGDPELGKSTLALTFAAVITTEYETEDGMMGGFGRTAPAANTPVTS